MQNIPYPVSVYNCYNAGSVEVTSTAYEDPETHGIVGGGEGTVQIENATIWKAQGKTPKQQP